MNRRRTAILLAAAALVLVLLQPVLTGCGDSRPAAAAPPPQPTQGAWRQPWAVPQEQLPVWVKDPSDGGHCIGAYGSVMPESNESLSDRRDRAAQQARLELSNMVHVAVKGAIGSYLKDTGQGTTDVAQSVSRQVTDQALNGTVIREVWVWERTGETFVWVVVDPEMARRLGAATVAAVKADPTLSAHAHAAIEADAAQRDLDRRLASPR